MPFRKSKPAIEMNLYFEPGVTKTAREAVHDGINLVNRYVGRIAIVSSGEVSLGQTDGERPFDVSNNRRWTHLTTADLTLVGANRPLSAPEFEAAGITFTGMTHIFERIAIIDTSSSRNRQGIRWITAHETCHLLGLKKPKESTYDEDNPLHCVSEGCIMRYKRFPSATSAKLINEGFPGGILPANDGFVTLMGLLNSSKPEDFCADCADNLREVGRTGIRQLRVPVPEGYDLFSGDNQ